MSKTLCPVIDSSRVFYYSLTTKRRWICHWICVRPLSLSLCVCVSLSRPWWNDLRVWWSVFQTERRIFFREPKIGGDSKRFKRRREKEQKKKKERLKIAATQRSFTSPCTDHNNIIVIVIIVIINTTTQTDRRSRPVQLRNLCTKRAHSSRTGVTMWNRIHTRSWWRTFWYVVNAFSDL